MSASRQPAWLLFAMAFLCVLAFQSIRYESSYIFDSSREEHEPKLKFQAKPIVPATIIVEKVVEKIVVREKIVEKIIEKIKIVGEEDATHRYSSNGIEDGTLVHSVFTTNCNQSDRQLLSTTLQMSAAKVNQRGPMTEIIAGSTQEQVVGLANEHHFYSNYHRHFTLSYGTDVYMPMNKPCGLRHFLKHAVAPVGVRGNMPIAIVDADFLFFQPLRVNTGRNITHSYKGANRTDQVFSDIVLNGQALAQDWSMHHGSGWFASEFKSIRDRLCQGKPCASIDLATVAEYYGTAGPPYIMTKNDAMNMVDDYCQYALEGQKISNSTDVEIHAYGLAVANSNIRHTLVSHFAPTSPTHESWSFLDSSFSNPCDDASNDAVLPEKLPVALHYRHLFGNKDGWHFSKHHLPFDILNCDAMLLQLLPSIEWTRIGNTSGPENQLTRHHVWSACTLVKIFNQFILSAKEQMCPFGYNTFQGIPLNESKRRDSAIPKKQ